MLQRSWLYPSVGSLRPATQPVEIANRDRGIRGTGPTTLMLGTPYDGTDILAYHDHNHLT